MRKFLLFVGFFTSIFVVFFIGRNFLQNNSCNFEFAETEGSNKIREIKLEKNQKNKLSDFNLTSNNSLLDNFGVTAKDALKKNPQILEALKKMDGDINSLSMTTGSENMVAILPEGKKFVVLNGCTQNKDFKCEGTVRIVVIDPINGRIYMLSENGSGKYAADPKVYIYGEPPSQITNLLLYSYFF